MHRSGSTHEADGGLEGRPPGGKRRSLPAEVQRLWREFKEFVLKALTAGDMVGEVLMDGYRLAAKAGGLLVRYGRYVAAFAVLVGLTSPATEGWGIAAFSGSALAPWVPVGLLPGTIVCVRIVVGSFGPLDRESERASSRGQQAPADGSPELLSGLARESSRRRALNRRIAVGDKAPLLETDPFVHDELAETAFQLNARELPEIDLILMRWTRKHGLRVVAFRGAVDDVAQGLLSALEWEDIFDGNGALENALLPLEYSHRAVAFTAGAHHYLLVGIAGAPIPGHAHLTISHTATRLVERYAGADELSLPAAGGLQ
jgi:hypothetical protein